MYISAKAKHNCSVFISSAYCMSTNPVLANREDLHWSQTVRGIELFFNTTWGLFSPKQLDAGSRLLLDHVNPEPDARILDLGCGYGPLGVTLARLCPQGQVDMVDKDFVAVEYAQKNALLNQCSNCEAYLSNGFSHIPDKGFDLIISNLPAKVGNELYAIFFEDARRYLRPGGRLYVVTIVGLKSYIQRSFKTHFDNYKKVKQSTGHIVSMAIYN
jgi:16S rRNA G1207 methylase RsmC